MHGSLPQPDVWLIFNDPKFAIPVKCRRLTRLRNALVGSDDQGSERLVRQPEVIGATARCAQRFQLVINRHCAHDAGFECKGPVDANCPATGWRSGMARAGVVCWNVCADLADSCGAVPPGVIPMQVTHPAKRLLRNLTADYILPAFMSATRFSKAEVLALSALPFAMAASPALRASSFLPAAQRMFVLAERFRNVSLTLID